MALAQLSPLAPGRPMIRPLRRLASTTLSLALVGAFSLPAPAAHASVWSVMATHAVDEPASVLGLESEDTSAGEALTKALRKAFTKRGYGGGQEMSLVELRLTMGCSGDDPKCLSEGGKAIEVRRLIYGHLKKTGGGGYSLSLTMLNVADATVEKETTNRPLSAADLSRDKIDATATAIVSSMLPQETTDEPTPEIGPTTDEPSTDPQPDQPQPRQSRDGKYIWGLDKPVPKWKAAGLGVSAGLFVVSLGAAIGLTIATKTTLRDRLVDEANASLEDTLEDGVTPNEANDVDPTIVSDICGEAKSTPETMDDPSTPDDERKFVKNKKITKVCNVARGVERGQFAAWAGVAVFGVSTIVFSVLLFVRKNDSAAAAAAYRHKLQLGAMPTSNGFRIGAGFKF